MSVGKKRHAKPGAKTNKIRQLGYCPVDGCTKIMYESRSDARRAARKFYPGDHLTAYECNGFWHFGHPPPKVIRGLGWGGETRLAGQAARIRDEELQEPLECTACGALVLWVPEAGHVHECEVTGVDDEERQT